MRVPSDDLYEIVTLTNFESRTIDNLFGNRLVSTLSHVNCLSCVVVWFKVVNDQTESKTNLVVNC